MKSLPPFLLFPLFVLLFLFQLLWLREDIAPVEVPPAAEKEEAKPAPKVAPRPLTKGDSARVDKVISAASE